MSHIRGGGDGEREEGGRWRERRGRPEERGKERGGGVEGDGRERGKGGRGRGEYVCLGEREIDRKRERKKQRKRGGKRVCVYVNEIA